MMEKQLPFSTRMKDKGESLLLRVWASEWGISLLLFILALIVRIPYLHDVPRFIDEWREIELGAQIARGEAWPLHNTSHDIGPFHNYVLAGLFSIFGYNVYLPRLYVALLSAATVVVTYWITRHWAGQMTALIAASLLATNSMHILVTHMAWSNVTTPFFVALAVLVTLKTIDRSPLHTHEQRLCSQAPQLGSHAPELGSHDREKRSLWALTGFVWTIALQTHPSVIAALIGLLFYLTRRFGWRAFYRESRFRTAIVVFIVGYSNMIVHNILKPFDSFLWIKRKDYALNQEFSIQGYFSNMVEMSSELVHSLSSTFPDGEGWLHGISLVLMFLFTIGLIDGFRRLCRFRHGALLLAILISSLLIIPILNDQYEFYLWTRYIAYLFPLCFVAVALGFGAWIRLWIGEGFSRWNRRRNLKRAAVLLAVWAVVLILPLHHFYSYADTYIQSGRDNSAEFSAVRTLLSENTTQSVIAVDKQGKQAEALSKMLRVKGWTSPLVGIDPNEGPEAQAILLNREEGKESVFYTRWEKVFAENELDTWYVLSLETRDQATALFGITWRDVQLIRGKGGKRTYFIGRVESME